MRRREGRIMLSYARPDEARVLALYARLEAEGLRPWMDVRDLRPGDDWRAAIERAVRTCDVFLAIISSHSLNRPGVLQGEIKEALDLWQERLDKDSFLIPLRLEDVPPPDRLSHLQWVNLFDPGGEELLVNTIRERIRQGAIPHRHWPLAIGAAVLVLLVAASVYFWQWGRYEREADAFASSRPGSVKSAAPSEPARIGITGWRASDSAEVSAPPSACADLKLTRIAMGETLKPKDRIRLGLEVNRAGYLYVFNRTAKANAASIWYLIFPTLKMRSGDNAVQAGTLVEIPPDNRACATFQVEPEQGSQGEQLAILLSPYPIAQLTPREEDYPVDPGLFESLRKGALQAEDRIEAKVTQGETRTPAEEQASEQWTRRLRYSEARPQTIMSFRSTTESRALFAEITLAVAAK